MTLTWIYVVVCNGIFSINLIHTKENYLSFRLQNLTSKEAGKKLESMITKSNSLVHLQQDHNYNGIIGPPMYYKWYPI